MIEEELEKPKPVKRYKCKLCRKKYSRWGVWMNRHVAKTGHNKFKKINGDGKFLAEY